MRPPRLRVIGCDISRAARACADRNIAAGGYAGVIELYPWDARAMPLPDRSVDALCCSLPYGHRVGSHAANVSLYPALLREAGRVARGGAHLVLLTQELHLLADALAHDRSWRVLWHSRVRLGGLYPQIVAAQRR